MIIVTISSIVATINITKVSLALDKQRQKELIISKIDYIDKLIFELKSNQAILEKDIPQLNGAKISPFIPQDTLSITKIENSLDIVVDKELSEELDSYLKLFKMIKKNFEDLDYSRGITSPNITVDITLQNINVILNGGRNVDSHIIQGLQDLITKVEKYKATLEIELIDLNKKDEKH